MARLGPNSQPPSGDGGEPREGGGTFDSVVLCHTGLIYQLALRLCGHRQEAEDLTQETLLRAHRAFDRFELREYGAKPWLIKILHHAFFTHKSQAARALSPLGKLETPETEAEAEQELQSLPDMIAGQLNWENFDQELKSAVDQLPIEYRSVILLWALGDLGYREIAHALGVPIGTVMSRLHRGRRMLAEELADYAAARKRTDPGAARPAGDGAKPGPGAKPG